MFGAKAAEKQPMFSKLQASAADMQAKMQDRVNNKMIESGVTAVVKALTGSLATWLGYLSARWAYRKLLEEFTVQVCVLFLTPLF